MSRSFALTAGMGVVSLLAFAYFIFGLNMRPSDEPTRTTSASTVTTAISPTSSEQIKIEDTKIGTGKEVKNGDTIVIHYTGTLQDGTKFDSSYDRNQPFETQIGVGSVIQGWDKGVLGMKVGGKRKLTIPPSLGYGDQDMGKIPPNSTLIFDVELIDVK